MNRKHLVLALAALLPLAACGDRQPQRSQEASANAAVSGAFDKSAQPVAPSAAASDQATAARPGDTPAQELDKIRQLFAQGQHDEALQRLRAFRQAHPQWPLPAELQAQLQEP